MIKNHSDNETRCRHKDYSVWLGSKGSFICTIPFYLTLHGHTMVTDVMFVLGVVKHSFTHPTDRIAYTTAFVTPVVEHWLEIEIAQLDQDERWMGGQIWMKGPVDTTEWGVDG